LTARQFGHKATICSGWVSAASREVVQVIDIEAGFTTIRSVCGQAGTTRISQRSLAAHQDRAAGGG